MRRELNATKHDTLQRLERSERASAAALAMAASIERRVHQVENKIAEVDVRVDAVEGELGEAFDQIIEAKEMLDRLNNLIEQKVNINASGSRSIGIALQQLTQQELSSIQIASAIFSHESKEDEVAIPELSNTGSLPCFHVPSHCPEFQLQVGCVKQGRIPTNLWPTSEWWVDTDSSAYEVNTFEVDIVNDELKAVEKSYSEGTIQDGAMHYLIHWKTDGTMYIEIDTPSTDFSQNIQGLDATVHHIVQFLITTEGPRLRIYKYVFGGVVTLDGTWDNTVLLHEFELPVLFGIVGYKADIRGWHKAPDVDSFLLMHINFEEIEVFESPGFFHNERLDLWRSSEAGTISMICNDITGTELGARLEVIDAEIDAIQEGFESQSGMGMLVDMVTSNTITLSNLVYKVENGAVMLRDKSIGNQLLSDGTVVMMIGQSHGQPRYHVDSTVISYIYRGEGSYETTSEYNYKMHLHGAMDDDNSFMWINPTEFVGSLKAPTRQFTVREEIGDGYGMKLWVSTNQNSVEFTGPRLNLASRSSMEGGQVRQIINFDERSSVWYDIDLYVCAEVQVFSGLSGSGIVLDAINIEVAYTDSALPERRTYSMVFGSGVFNAETGFITWNTYTKLDKPSSGKPYRISARSYGTNQKPLMDRLTGDGRPGGLARWEENGMQFGVRNNVVNGAYRMVMMRPLDWPADFGFTWSNTVSTEGGFWIGPDSLDIILRLVRPITVRCITSPQVGTIDYDTSVFENIWMIISSILEDIYELRSELGELEQRVEFLEIRTSPSVLGQLAGAAMMASNFLNPGSRLFLALLGVGSALEVADAIERSMALQAGVSVAAAFMALITFARAHHKANKPDEGPMIGIEDKFEYMRKKKEFLTQDEKYESYSIDYTANRKVNKPSGVEVGVNIRHPYDTSTMDNDVVCLNYQPLGVLGKFGNKLESAIGSVSQENAGVLRSFGKKGLLPEHCNVTSISRLKIHDDATGEEYYRSVFTKVGVGEGPSSGVKPSLMGGKVKIPAGADCGGIGMRIVPFKRDNTLGTMIVDYRKKGELSDADYLVQCQAFDVMMRGKHADSIDYYTDEQIGKITIALGAKIRSQKFRTAEKANTHIPPLALKEMARAYGYNGYENGRWKYNLIGGGDGNCQRAARGLFDALSGTKMNRNKVVTEEFMGNYASAFAARYDKIGSGAYNDWLISLYRQYMAGYRESQARAVRAFHLCSYLL